jgi:hypothetical protein
MNQIRNFKQGRLGHLILGIGVYLACLREAASAEAGIWNLRFENWNLWRSLLCDPW